MLRAPIDLPNNRSKLRCHSKSAPIHTTLSIAPRSIQLPEKYRDLVLTEILFEAICANKSQRSTTPKAVMDCGTPSYGVGNNQKDEPTSITDIVLTHPAHQRPSYFATIPVPFKFSGLQFPNLQEPNGTPPFVLS